MARTAKKRAARTLKKAAKRKPGRRRKLPSAKLPSQSRQEAAKRKAVKSASEAAKPKAAASPRSPPRWSPPTASSRTNMRASASSSAARRRFTELGIFSAMWNEHCSYKSSKVHLRTLPTKAPWVIQGPGENAGVIDIGDGLAVRVQDGEPQPPELHRALSGRGHRRRRHPARRLHHGRAADRLPQRAVASAIRRIRKTRHLVSGVVAGIGGYGN